MNKIYKGSRTKNEISVTVDGKPLDPRTNLRNHSPTGFNWGYSGSGPAQLSLAVIADAVGEQRAERIYQDFKFAVIAHLQEDTWSLSEESVFRWVKERETLQVPEAKEVS